MVYVTDAELSDVHQLADAWGVKASAAAWAILAERLDRYHRRASRLPQLGDVGLALVALAGVLRLPVDWKRWRGWHGQRSSLEDRAGAGDA